MDMPSQPDALAKKFFLITMFAALAYITVTVVVINSPDGHEADGAPPTSSATVASTH